MRLKSLAMVLLTTIGITAVAALDPPAAAQTLPYSTPAQKAQIIANYGKLPMIFEANQGQTDPQVRFLSRGAGYTAFLTTGGVVLSLRPMEGTAAEVTGSSTVASGTGQHTKTALQFTLVGAAKNPVVLGEEPQSARVNYFIGNDPTKWRTNIPSYAKIRYKNVYPGIDLVYYGNQQQLEYDFVVSPHSDPNKIQFELGGASQLKVDADGNLIVSTQNGDLRFQSPAIYQESNGSRIPIRGGYVVKDRTHVGFVVAAHDRTKLLVIDPVLIYATYLGGSGNDKPAGIAVDSTGSVYVAGYTDSIDFPLATFGSLAINSTHVFVAKLDATGSNLVYADYLGGNSQDLGYALVLDASNEVYVTGSTASSDFPTVNAFQSTYPGSFNAFLAKLSVDGSALLYSTYLGGNGSDQPAGIAIDTAGSVVVAGNTSSTNFPVANAFQATVSANQGGVFGTYGFLTKFSADGTSLVYSTYFSGNSNVVLNCGGTPCWPSPYSGISGVALDGSGNAYAAGMTNTYNFPTTEGAFLTSDTTAANGMVGFVSKFSASGSLAYSTYFYGSSGAFTVVDAIAVDGSGSAYVTGAALSDGTFPVTSTNICDPKADGWACNFAFVTKFDPTGSTLAYSTFLGPNNSASPMAIALDAENNAYVLAATSSSSFTTVDGIEAFAGGSDILLVKIDAAANSELMATYFGGNGDEFPGGLALDSSGNIYVAGSTSSTDFPVLQGSFQNTFGGNTDAFVVKIGTESAPSVAISPASLQFATQGVGGTSQPQTVLLRNMGSASLSISSIHVTGDFQETDTCGATVPAGGSCTFSISFAPIAVGTRSGSVVIQDNTTASVHVIGLTGLASGVVVGLSPDNLGFDSVQVGTSSAVQTVSLTNNGDLSMSISNIQASADYHQTNNCGATLSSGASCTISVTFAPTVAGKESGTLTITDSALDSPQIVPLGGAGADFSLASSSSSDTIKAGGAATYTLTINSVGGSFTNPVQLSCSGAPAQSSCSFSPATVNPNGDSATATMTIRTNAAVAQALPNHLSETSPIYATWIPLQGFGLFGIVLAGSRRRSKQLSKAMGLVVIAVALSVMVGCAGGTGIASQPQGGTAPGNYAVTVTGTAGATQHSVAVNLTVQ